MIQRHSRSVSGGFRKFQRCYRVCQRVSGGTRRFQSHWVSGSFLGSFSGFHRRTRGLQGVSGVFQRFSRAFHGYQRGFQARSDFDNRQGIKWGFRCVYRAFQRFMVFRNAREIARGFREAPVDLRGFLGYLRGIQKVNVLLGVTEIFGRIQTGFSWFNCFQTPWNSYEILLKPSGNGLKWTYWYVLKPL